AGGQPGPGAGRPGARMTAEATLAADARQALGDLTLVLEDSKRLLGMRYAGWILGAPELEAGIAAASMAQDEWGHARLLYALLRDFDLDPDHLEHEREPAGYRNIEVLDAAPTDWPGLVAINVLVDGALTVQLEALRETVYTPLRQRVSKMLEEERFHEAHGAAWFRRLASADPGRDRLREWVAALLPGTLRWFGPDSATARGLQDASIVGAAGSTLRTRFLERIAPLIARIDAADSFASIEPDFTDFDEARRRAPGGGPDAETIANVRGDRNREFLLE